MPNGSKQYQQTESDCLRNSDGNAFGRNIVCQHRRQHEKSDPQRDFRQQGLSPGWFGAIRRDSMIREHRAILRHSAIRAPVQVRNPVFPAALRDSARPPAHRPLGVHAVSSAGRPNSRELTAACNGDCPTHSRLSGNIASATASTETTAKIHFRFIATSFL